MTDRSPSPDRETVECEITGKTLPADETVFFQGRRVGAEGKEKIIELLKSGHVLPGEMESPTVLRRATCIVADMFLLWLVSLLILLLFKNLGMHRGLFNQGLQNITTVLIYIVYFAVFHVTLGQTPGKMSGRIKVVMKDGSPLNTKAAFIRSFFFIGIYAVPGIGMLAANYNFTMGLMLYNMVAGVYFLLNVLFALVDRYSQRAIHDLVAGTRVIIVD